MGDHRNSRDGAAAMLCWQHLFHPYCRSKETCHEHHNCHNCQYNVLLQMSNHITLLFMVNAQAYLCFVIDKSLLTYL